MTVRTAVHNRKDALIAVLARHLYGRPRQLAWLLMGARMIPLRSARSRVFRSVSWPLVQAVDTRLTVSTAGGWMDVDTGDAVGRVLAVSGVWEPNLTAIVRRVLAPGDVFVDLGAHTGYYTILAASIVGESGHVYAFEPSPTRYGELRANLERNQATNVSAFDVAAGSRGGVATLYDAPRPNTSASTLSAGALAHPAVATAAEYKPVRVAVVAAESRISVADLDRVRVVKVDVEGYEVEALRGLEHVLAVAAPVVILVELSPTWRADGPGVLEQLCERHGLEAWLVANEYSPTGYFPVRPQPPLRLAAIPSERCDLALVRGFTGADLTGRRGSS